MNVRNTLKAAAVALSLPLLLLADIAPEAPFGLTLGREATAIVGRPATPMSYAGVARRTTARVVTTEAVVVSSAPPRRPPRPLPRRRRSSRRSRNSRPRRRSSRRRSRNNRRRSPSSRHRPPARRPSARSCRHCPRDARGVAKGGVEYYRCGAVYYRAAFQGNNLVYVTVAQP